MKDGFIKAAAVTPVVHVADPAANAEEIIGGIREALAEEAKIIVFPELSVTGYTCGDLFLQKPLLDAAAEALKRIAGATEGSDALVFVGTPLVLEGKLYNAAAAVSGGRVLAFIPKIHIPNYAEFYEARHFSSGRGVNTVVPLPWDRGSRVPAGSRILFDLGNSGELVVAAEICEDLWVADAPDIRHSLAGATVIVNLSASDEVVGKGAYRRELIRNVSARTVCAYIYADAGEGESTTDLVFGGQSMIAENGAVLAEGELFKPGITVSEIDVQKIAAERRRMSTFVPEGREDYLVLHLPLAETETKLTRSFDPRPFVPADPALRKERAEEILAIQARGLAERMRRIGSKAAVVGVSGGLDSTLALLVTARAFDLLGLERDGILAVTMPCFGTTDRTYGNACRLAVSLGAVLKEVPIAAAVRQHFADIGHDPEARDVTYENAQARERTQVLMDLANQINGLVVGTGDLSELALGWATYNGDHMSMYGVNGGVPKTLVRHLVAYCAEEAEAEAEKPAESISGEDCGPGLREVLLDILDTPVSPELLPPSEDGKIAQKTEDIVGPYELHDFFLYYMLRFGFPPEKILRIAESAFAGEFDRAAILKWLKKFYWRFFTQQFKRSCLPDGPKVGSAALSPRGDWRMPSDASVSAWIKRLDGLE